MVSATVDNNPVAIIISGGSSTTVPTGETWRVSIHSNRTYQVNSTDTNKNSELHVFTEGDTIKSQDSGGTVCTVTIDGWVV